MKILGKDFINGIKKANGVVGDGSVIEHLRGFVFNPRPSEGLLDIAGSDGRLSLFAQIPYTQSSDSDNTLLSLPSDKLREMIKFISDTDEVTISYTESSDTATFKVGNFTWSTHKKSFENDLIDFSYVDFNSFEDDLNASEFEFILNSLIPIANVGSHDYANQTIYLNKTHAFLFEGTLLSKIVFPSKETYAIDFKSAKQIQMILKSNELEHVKLKYFPETEQVLLKTDKDVLVYRVHDPVLPNISFVYDFESFVSFNVPKSEIVRSVLRTKLATEDEEIQCKLSDTVLKLVGIGYNGECADDNIFISDYKGTFKGEYRLLVSKFIQLCGAIRTQNLVIDLDTESYMLRIRDTQDKSLSIMSISFD